MSNGPKSVPVTGEARAEMCDECDGALEPGHKCESDTAAPIASALEAKLWLVGWIGNVVPQETIDEMAEELACIIEDSPCATCDAHEAPYVCPGCHAVAPDRCVPGCIDDEIARDRENEADNDDEKPECPLCGLTREHVHHDL